MAELCRLLVLLDVILLVSGLGTFQVRISTPRRYYRTSTELPTNGTVPLCRTFVHYCLTNYQRPAPTVPFIGKCQYGEMTSPASTGCSLLYPNNTAVSMPFTFSWPKSFTLIVEVYDDMTSDGPSPNSPRQLVVGDVISAITKPRANWTVVQHNSSDVGILLEYAFRVVCDVNYYSAGCSVYCRLRDDIHGHWTCAPGTGQRRCLPGWQGNFCTTAICQAGCSTKHGYCNIPGQCLCRAGWQGDLCDECTATDCCIREHATCAEPGRCDCLPGWAGQCCDIDVNYCLHHEPCLNGGTCVNDAVSAGFRCLCDVGFTGAICEHVRCPTCHNAGQCDQQTGACRCGPRYTGRYCETPLTEHTTTTTNTSITTSSITTSSSSSSSCGGRRLCQHGATCVVTTQSTYFCLCTTDYTGANCDTPVNTTSRPHVTALSFALTRMTELITSPADVTTTLPDDVTTVNASHVGETQLLSADVNDDVMTTLILGVTLGALFATATFIITCVVWLVCRRRRRRQATTADNGNTRVDPETTDNRRNESTLPRNNDVTSPCSRYTKDGTLVLTVTNKCTGNGTDVSVGRASDIKNGNAVAGKSPGKRSISTVSDDVTRFSRTATDDVNVWPYRSSDDCEASALCDVERGGKYDDDVWTTRLRRQSSEKYHTKYPHRAVSPTEHDEWQSFRVCAENRYEATSEEHVVETVSAHLAHTTQRYDDFTLSADSNSTSHVVGHVIHV